MQSITNAMFIPLHVIGRAAGSSTYSREHILSCVWISEDQSWEKTHFFIENHES